AGFDTLQFNGAAIAENIDISANGDRVRFFRDVATVTMDLNGVERVEFNALGGPDIIKVHDLSGTNATQVVVNLAGTLGGSTGDGAPGQGIAHGTQGDNHISITAGAAPPPAGGLSPPRRPHQARDAPSPSLPGRAAHR